MESAKDFLISTMKVVCDSLTTEGGGQDRDGKAETELTLISLDQSARKSNTGPYPHLSSSWKDICGPSSTFESKIREQYDSLTKDISLFKTLLESTQEREAIKLKAEWKRQFAGDRQKLSSMIWLLAETSYIYLRRAKLLYHATGLISFDNWIKSARASNLGLDLCRHLPFSHLEFQLQNLVKLHSLYGIALANLGRFFEANRHLNEAQALLSKTPSATGADFAIVNLRRAEARLTECYWVRMFLAEQTATPSVPLTLCEQGRLKSDVLSRHLGPIASYVWSMAIRCMKVGPRRASIERFVIRQRQRASSLCLRRSLSVFANQVSLD